MSTGGVEPSRLLDFPYPMSSLLAKNVNTSAAPRVLIQDFSESHIGLICCCNVFLEKLL